MKKMIAAVAVLFVMNAATFADSDVTESASAMALNGSQASMSTQTKAPVRGDFLKGSWSMQSYGSGTFGDDSGDLYLAHFGGGYYFMDDLSINVELFGGAIDGEDGATADSMIGVDLLLRWHFLKGENWSIYGDAGSGIVWSNEPYPQGGTHQNFTPQAGLGLTLELSENVSFMGGARWHHISNANKRDAQNNPAFDAGMIYAGLMWAF